MSDIISIPSDFSQCLIDLDRNLSTRWNAVVKLARHPEHPRWYEAWQEIEKRIEGEQSEILRSLMAQALSMISARNNPDPYSMLLGNVPDFLVTYEEYRKYIRHDPTLEDWQYLADMANQKPQLPGGDE